MPIDPATGQPRTIAPAFKFGSAHDFITQAKQAFTVRANSGQTRGKTWGAGLRTAVEGAAGS